MSSFSKLTAGPLLSGKKGLVMGVANDRSIAWGIAKVAHAHGADLAFTYQNIALEKRVRPLVESLGQSFLLQCDVSHPKDMEVAFTSLKERWRELDFIVHAIAYSNKEELKGRYIDTTLDNFLRTMAISCFSFTEVCRRAQVLMPPGSTLLTLTYYGSERVIPHYNVMGVAKAALEASVRYLATDLGTLGIRVNAISAGPIKTLAASGIGNFRHILRWNELNAPLKRNTTIADISGSALYFLSDLSKGVTGEIHHVDSGYHTVGMIAEDSTFEIAELLNQFKE